jgi:hypothetical protein
MSSSRRLLVTVRRSGLGELHGYVDGVETLDAFVCVLEGMGWVVLASPRDHDRDGRFARSTEDGDHRRRNLAELGAPKAA